MSRPGFFLVGAPRCGTSMLYGLIGAHPQVFTTPNKEPWFYALEGNPAPFTGPGDGQGIRDRREYEALFAEAGSAAAIGEASTLYLASDVAPVAIKEELPEARIIVMLRDPVDRAFSNYSQHRWQGRETLGFEEAVEAGPGRVAAGWAPFWDYRAMSRYGDQLERWYSLFPQDQIHVVVFDEFVDRRSETLAAVYRFLQEDAGFVPEGLGPVNAAGQPRWPRLHAFLRGSSPAKRLLRATVPERVRVPIRTVIDWRNSGPRQAPEPAFASSLTQEFSTQLAMAEKLTGLDLPPWGR